jgi:hypothetical protein
MAERLPLNPATMTGATFPPTFTVDEDLFQDLARQWRKETAHHSLMFKKAMHPLYQRIIGLGWGVTPLLLRELQATPGGYWFWALEAVTSENPAANAQNIDDARQAWLIWGKGVSSCTHKE